MRIPKSVRFPGPYVVAVKVTGRPHKVNGSVVLEEDDDAGWHSGERVICIWEGLTPRQRALKLAHELQHVVNDYELWVRQQVGAE